MLKLVGYPISPFVRKVRIGLEMKEVEYEIDPLNPYIDKARLLPLNPNGTVPVLVNDAEVISESSDILSWLDQTYPEKRIFPENREKFEHAKKLEAGADYQLMGIFGGSLFFQRIVMPFYLKRAGNDNYIQQALNQAGPELLQQLNEIVPQEGYLVGTFSAADIAITSWIRGGLLSGLLIEQSTFSNLHAYLKRSYEQPPYQRVIECENQSDVILWAKDKWQLSDPLIGFK